jgi:hypothetical protein
MFPTAYEAPRICFTLIDAEHGGKDGVIPRHYLKSWAPWEEDTPRVLLSWTVSLPVLTLRSNHEPRPRFLPLPAPRVLRGASDRTCRRSGVGCRPRRAPIPLSRSREFQATAVTAIQVRSNRTVSLIHGLASSIRGAVLRFGPCASPGEHSAWHSQFLLERPIEPARASEPGPCLRLGLTGSISPRIRPVRPNRR